MNTTISGTVRVSLRLLDKLGAIIPTENLPIMLNNHPHQLLGTCRVERDNEGQCIGVLIFDDEVSGDLFFYYASHNTDDGTFWFMGINLSEQLYANKPTLRLKDKIL
jgi:hypothetical protein